MATFARWNKDKGKILKPWADKDSYLHVTLWNNSQQKRHAIHLLVANTFLGAKPFEDAQVCHEDNDRQNCRMDNLRWDTCKNNHKDKVKHGTFQIGDKHGRTKYSEALVSKIRDDLNKDIPRKVVAKTHSVPLTLIHDIALRRRRVIS